MNHAFNFNTLVKINHLFKSKQKISPLSFKYDKYKIFKLYETDNYKPIEKIDVKKIKNIYKVSKETEDMYNFLILLISDFYNNVYAKEKVTIKAINYLIKNKKLTGEFYKDLLEIFLIIKKSSCKNIYSKISSQIYHKLIKKSKIITEIYLFLIYALVTIKKKSIGENICFDIFKQEPLLEIKNHEVYI